MSQKEVQKILYFVNTNIATMTKMKRTCPLIAFILFLSVSCLAQEWTWNWTGQSTQKDASAWMEILNIDFQGNVYTGTQYGDSLFLNDTVFAHESYYDWSNWAIEKYNAKGNLLQALDVYTTLNNFIYNLKLATDKDLNIYLAGEFTREVFFLDTVVSESFPTMGAPQLFLAKITPEMKVEWTRLISSRNQNVCDGLILSSDNYLYMVTLHYGNGSSTDTVIYFGQDTTVYETTFCSLLKMDLSGNLVWRKEFRSDASGIDVREINIDNAGKITLNGHLRDNLFYEDDTIFHPHPGANKYRPFIMEIDADGNLLSGEIPDWYMALADLKKDESGDFYLAGFVQDTLYFGADTIIRDEDSTVNILAKLNPAYEPLWYETVSAKTEQGAYYFYIDTSGDTLFFGGRCKNTFTLFDTTFHLGSRYQGVIGKVTPEGQMKEYKVTYTQAGCRLSGMQLNNCCNELYISGGFKGLAWFGEDTLRSYTYSDWDAVVAALNMYEPYQFDLGPDTIVCDSIRLFGPEGYPYYFWNGQPSENNWLDVTESGVYTFACTGEEGCWLRDTIAIDVQPGFSVDIGQDTIIGLNDTLYLSVPDIYDGYVWSTGETGNEIEITGSSMGQGDWNVWVEVTSGVCTATDTIQLTVSSVDELQNMGVRIYPNPTGNTIHVFSERKFKKIELLDQKGTVLFGKKGRNTSPDQVQINLSHLPRGIYFVRIFFDDSVGTGKIIKL